MGESHFKDASCRPYLICWVGTTSRVLIEAWLACLAETKFLISYFGQQCET